MGREFTASFAIGAGNKYAGGRAHGFGILTQFAALPLIFFRAQERLMEDLEWESH